MSELHTIRQRDMRIAGRILFLLERKEMTQGQLLEKSKVPKTALKNILENGYFDSQMKDIIKIADTLEASLDWILYGNNIYSDVPDKTLARKIAVFDGAGETATWGLYYQYGAVHTEEIAWPGDWPSKVDRKFLTEKGFTCINA